MMKICPSIAVHWIAEGSPETKYTKYIFFLFNSIIFSALSLERQKFLLKYIQKKYWCVFNSDKDYKFHVHQCQAQIEI